MNGVRVLTVTLTATLMAACAMSRPPRTGTAASSAAASDAAIRFQGDFRGPLGLQLWSVRDYISKDVPGTLARVHDWGFREVELAGTYGLTPARFRQELDRAGLRATSMHVDFARLRDSTTAAMADARTLGVQYVGVAWLPHQGAFTAANAHALAADLDRIGRAARQQGLTFFYHLHGYEFQPGPGGTGFETLVRETSPDDVKFEMDVFWITRPGQDPVALLRQYPNRWVAMHLKDMAKGTPTNDFSGSAPATADVPVGTGQIDYRAVLRTGQQLGIRKFYIEDESPAPLTNVPLSIEWIRTVRF